MEGAVRLTDQGVRSGLDRPMKVFWFTNTAMPGLSEILGRPSEVVGGWMSSLLDALARSGQVDLAVATKVRGQRAMEKHVSNGVTYFCLPGTKPGGPMTREFVSACTDALRAFQPDIIHVHGTEDVYGMFTAQHARTVPAVISIQGLIHACRRHVTGGLTLGHAVTVGRDGVLAWLRFRLQELQWARRGRGERRILRGNRYFLGRTGWDRSHVLAVNPEAQYFHSGELLRAPFFGRTWDMRRCDRHTIFCTAAHSPLKGFHVLLNAVAILRDEFPDIRVRVAGAPWDAARGRGYYGRYVKALIDKRGLSRHVTALPSLDAEGVADELAGAHAFVIPSLIENSPNSLAEAMLVGTPCIAAMVGGIPSMIDDGDTALGFPRGDEVRLAGCIRRVFSDATFSQQMSSKARSLALRRHDPDSLVTSQLTIYRTVIAASRGAKAIA